MDRASYLGSVVAEVALRILHDSRHGRDDNDRRRKVAVAFSSSLEQRQEYNCAEIDGGHIGVVSLGPALECLVVEKLLLHVGGLVRVWNAFLARDSGCGNEKVDVFLLGRQLLVHALQVVFLGYVTGRERDDLPALIWAVRLRCGIEGCKGSVQSFD
jgi:hypothetical protein